MYCEMMNRDQEALTRSGHFLPSKVKDGYANLPSIVDLRYGYLLEGERDGAMPGDWAKDDWDALLVAHGSSKDPASRHGAEQIARSLMGQTSASNIATCFIEETPFVQDVSQALRRPTAVMGLFAAPGGHALDDVPEALNEVAVPVQYSGAIGEDARMADVIMDILKAEMTTELVAS